MGPRMHVKGGREDVEFYFEVTETADVTLSDYIGFYDFQACANPSSSSCVLI